MNIYSTRKANTPGSVGRPAASQRVAIDYRNASLQCGSHHRNANTPRGVTGSGLGVGVRVKGYTRTHLEVWVGRPPRSVSRAPCAVRMLSGEPEVNPTIYISTVHLKHFGLNPDVATIIVPLAGQNINANTKGVCR